MKAKSLKFGAALALAALLLLAGFELGARSVKFSAADSVEFSGLILGGPAAKPSKRSM